MTTRHVQENLEQRDDFIAPNTFLAIKREVIRFNKLTSGRTDEFSEADLRQLIEDFKKGNPLLKNATSGPYELNAKPVPYGDLVISVGPKALIRVCRENKTWVFRYNANDPIPKN